MTNADSDNQSLTPDDLRRYRAGQLSASEQHRIERLLLERPLYADALEGLEAMEQQGVAADAVSGALRERLRQRVQPRPTRRLPVWIPAAAAVLLLTLGFVGYLFLQKDPVEQPRLSESVRSKPAPLPEAQPQLRPTEPERSLALNRPQISRKKVEPKRSVITRKPLADSVIISLTPDALALVATPSETLVPGNAAPEATRVVAPGGAAPGVVAPQLANQRLMVPPGAAAPGAAPSSATTPAVVGRVVDEKNQPVSGALVMVKGARQGTSTDTTGQFRLDQVLRSDSLLISMVGYKQQTLRAADAVQVPIQLKPDHAMLAEVVVVGYSNPVRKATTGSVARINGSALPKAPANYLVYLRENQRIPPEAAAQNRSGVVRLRFRVKRDGSVDKIKVVKSLGYGLDEEAIRLLREGPRWQPAIRNGKRIKHRAEQEIEF